MQFSMTSLLLLLAQSAGLLFAMPASIISPSVNLKQSFNVVTGPSSNYADSIAKWASLASSSDPLNSTNEMLIQQQFQWYIVE